VRSLSGGDPAERPRFGPVEELLPFPLEFEPNRLLAFLDDGLSDRRRAALTARLREWEPRLPVAVEIVPGGEVAKSIDAWRQRALICRDRGIDRRSLLLAIGGGALCDGVGFTAATWHRGVPWCALPTTLLAMADAGIGGKTALDLEALKNPIGAFWSPEAIGIDPSFLESLPARELRSGWAEMIKAAWIGDAALFEQWEATPPSASGSVSDLLRAPTREELERVVEVKLKIVECDPRESGPRRVLNLGHTLGHAIEALESVEAPRRTHGEAVAVGMAFAARHAVARDPSNRHPLRLLRLLDACGFETAGPTTDFDALLSLVRSDKKCDVDAVTFALPVEPGRVDLVSTPLSALRDTLRSGAVPHPPR